MELLVPELLHAVSITPLNTQKCSQRSWLEGTGNSLMGTGSFLKAWQSPRGGTLGLNSQSVELALLQLHVNL